MPTDRRSLDIGVVAGCKSIPGPNWNYDRSVVELESIKIDIKLSGRSVDRKSEWEDRLRRDLRSLRGSSSLSKWNGIFGHCKGTDWLGERASTQFGQYTIIIIIKLNFWFMWGHLPISIIMMMWLKTKQSNCWWESLFVVVVMMLFAVWIMTQKKSLARDDAGGSP